LPDSDSASHIIAFDLIFVGLMSAYGMATGTLDLQRQISDITKPFTFANIIPQCSQLDIICQINAGAVAAAYPFFQFVWLILQFLEKISAGIVLLARIISFTTTDFGIPFVGWIFLLFNVSLLLYGISLLRGREP